MISIPSLISTSSPSILMFVPFFPLVLDILTWHRMVIRLFLLFQMKMKLMGTFLNQLAGILPILIVSDEILRWHFHQSVLANMRGSGEPIFETDFSLGTDQMKTLSSEPYGKERFEMEISKRLRFSTRDE